MIAADVVIPTWNGRDLLDRCLRALAQQTVQVSITVVDNGSTDGTPEHVRRAHPGVRIVRLPRNEGFAAAVNRGIAACSQATVVLVNNDVECDPPFVERIVVPLQTEERVGSVAGLLLVPGRGRIDSYGLEADRTLAPFPRFVGAPYPASALHEQTLLGPSGGAAAYRRAALEAVGGFDEALFAYLEDADLALRLRAAGWRAAGARDATAVHLGSASFGRRSAWQVETSGASRAYLLRKYGVLRAGPVLAAWAVAAEAGVVIVDAASARRCAALRGRLRGWRLGRGTAATAPTEALNFEIGFVESLRRRRSAVRG